MVETGTASTVELELPGGTTTVTVATEDDTELGRWTFDAGAGPCTLTVDWLAGERMVRLEQAGRPVPATEGPRDVQAAVRPMMRILVESGAPAVTVLVKLTSTEVLKHYYQGEEHQREYASEHPFIPAFHGARLRVLGRLFAKHIEASDRVLDVGSGYSIFYQVPVEWPFTVTCCDLDAAAMEKMRGLAPEWDWVVSDATDLPWDDSSFDVVYAGEIIEHVPDPEAAVAEWRRVLSGGGVMILSTPNRLRLLARSNRADMPCHDEHVREFSLAELRGLLRGHGFEMLKETGIYLELAQNWWRPPGRRADLLVARFYEPRHGYLYRGAMRLGPLAPPLAFDLVVVCRKR